MAVTIQFMVPTKESERFDTAFRRFVDLRPAPAPEGLSRLSSEPHGPLARKSVTLPDDESLFDFVRFWGRCRLTGPDFEDRFDLQVWA